MGPSTQSNLSPSLALLAPRSIVGHLTPVSPFDTMSTDELLGCSHVSPADAATAEASNAMLHAASVNQLCALKPRTCTHRHPAHPNCSHRDKPGMLRSKMKPGVLQTASEETLADETTPTAGAAPDVATPQLMAGQRVRAQYGGYARWFPGTVHQVHPDGSCSIHYDDGDVEEGVQPCHIKPAPSKGVKAASAAVEAAEVSAALICSPQKPPTLQRQRSSKSALARDMLQSHVEPAAAEAVVGSAAHDHSPQKPPTLQRQRSSKSAVAREAAQTRLEPADVDGVGESAAHAHSPQRLPTLKRQRSSRSAVRTEATPQPLEEPPQPLEEPTEPAVAERLIVLLDKASAETPPARSTVQALLREVRALQDEQLRELQVVPLRAMLQQLCPLLEAGAAELKAGGEGAQDHERALEAALLVLSVVSIGGMPRELLVQELLEAVVCLAKEAHSALSKGASATQEAGAEDSPAPGKRKSAKPKNTRKDEAGAHGSLILVIERLPALILTGGLDDSLLLQLGQLGLEATLGEGPLSLQMGGMQVVLTVFAEYEVHRKTLLHDMLDTRFSLPVAASQDDRRNYQLHDGAKVQMFSVLCVLLLQATAKLPPEEEQETEREKPHPFHEVERFTRTLIGVFVTRCLSRLDDAESKGLLEEFVRDVLLMLGKPEFPAASLIVKHLAPLFCQWLRERKQKQSSEMKDTPAHMLVLDCLGNLLSTLHEMRRKHADAPLTLPEPKSISDEMAQPNDSGEDSRCFCGRGYTEGDFMLDCDTCHRWFHGACVGVPCDDEPLPPKWFCDNCRIRTAVNQQRQRIGRLLAATLPDGGASDVEGLCSDGEVAKQLVCNYLQAAEATDPLAVLAQRLFLCEWHSTAIVRRETTRTLCALYREMDLEMADARRLQHAEPGRRVPVLTREAILAGCRRLLVDSSLFDNLEPMLRHLLMTLQDAQISSRAKAVRQLGAIVRADADTLKLPIVTQGVKIALADGSIAVREATLELLGQYLVVRPEFVEHYYETIVKRLNDLGTSVRKRVIKILRDLVLKQPDGPRAVDVCCRLVSRISDVDEVHKLVLRTFQELWFTPPAFDGGDLAEADVVARCDQMIGVVAKVRATAEHSNWLQQLLTSLLEPAESGKASKEQTGVVKMCERLVKQMVKALLRLDGEQREAKDATDGAAALRDIEEQMANTLHALALFSNARPALLLNHISLLPHFLTYESNHGVIQNTCMLLLPLLNLIERPPSDFLEKLETYLTAICFRVPEELIMVAIPTLCLTVTRSANFKLLVEFLYRFFDFLDRWKKADPETAAKQGPSAKRAMLCMGLLCRYFDFDSPSCAATYLNTEDGSHVLAACGNINQRAFQLLASCINHSTPVQSSLYAFKGLGQLCIRKPEFVARCKSLFESALRPDADLKLKRQALNILLLLLEEDLKRQRLAQQTAAPLASARTVSDAVATVVETSAAISGALQLHLQGVLSSLLDGRDRAVRHAALLLTSAMLREGLAHPMACLPKVIALEIDANGCAELAKAELRKHFERHSGTLSNPGVAVDGALAAYKLQQSLPPEMRLAPAHAGGGDARRLPHVTFLFSLLSANRRARHLMLKAFLTKLEPDDQLMKAPAAEWVPIVERAEWIAHTLCEFPFEKEDDVLTTVHQITRQLSLSAENTLKAAATALGDNPDKPMSVSQLMASRKTLSSNEIQHFHAAAMLNLLLKVKDYLKQQYMLSDSKCQTYDPSDSSRGSERQVVRKGDGLLLDTLPLWVAPMESSGVAASKSKVPNGQEQTSADGESDGESLIRKAMEQPAIAYVWLRTLFANDEEVNDFNMLPSIAKRESARKESAAKTPRKRQRKSAGSEGDGLQQKKSMSTGRRKKKKPSESLEDDDDDDEADDDPEYVEA